MFIALSWKNWCAVKNPHIYLIFRQEWQLIILNPAKISTNRKNSTHTLKTKYYLNISRFLMYTNIFTTSGRIKATSSSLPSHSRQRFTKIHKMLAWNPNQTLTQKPKPAKTFQESSAVLIKINMDQKVFISELLSILLYTYWVNGLFLIQIL